MLPSTECSSLYPTSFCCDIPPLLCDPPVFLLPLTRTWAVGGDKQHDLPDNLRRVYISPPVPHRPYPPALHSTASSYLAKGGMRRIAGGWSPWMA